jgi:hypothetical protein
MWDGDIKSLKIRALTPLRILVMNPPYIFSNLIPELFHVFHICLIHDLSNLARLFLFTARAHSI